MSSLVSLSRHTLKQLKFVLPGAALSYYFDSHNRLRRLLAPDSGSDSWAPFFARLSLASAAVTVSLFLYVLLLPLIQGQQPNYRRWRESGVLSSVIPIMTASIVGGWCLLSYTLGRWSNLGYLEGTIAASGLYALAFGLLGLLPAPKVHRQ